MREWRVGQRREIEGIQGVGVEGEWGGIEEGCVGYLHQ